MHSLTFLASETCESTATETILAACRYNENRGLIHVHGATVSFTPTPVVGGHEAVMRNAEGVVVALANVDEFDN